MLNLIEKPFYFGLGLFSYSKEKIEKFANELVKAGKIDKNDVEGFISEMLERGSDQNSEIRKIIREEFARTLDNLNIAQKKDIVTSDSIRIIIREELAGFLKGKEL